MRALVQTDGHEAAVAAVQVDDQTDELGIEPQNEAAQVLFQSVPRPLAVGLHRNFSSVDQDRLIDDGQLVTLQR